MLRPWWVDLVAGLAPLAVGAALFGCGVYLNLLSRRARVIGASLAIMFLVSVAILSFTPLQDEAGGFLYHAGGTVQLAVWPTCLLVGLAVGSPRRTWSRGFAVFLGVLPGVLLVMAGAGRVVWRFCGDPLWANTVDAEGGMKQTNMVTCVPASATILLHRHGIAMTEGEMAYLSGTSLFGTNLPTLAYALNRRHGPDGWRAVVQRLSYDECKQLGGPVLAEVTVTLGIRRHATVVDRFAEDHVEVVDPLVGRREYRKRADFERSWTGRIVRVERGP